MKDGRKDIQVSQDAALCCPSSFSLSWLSSSSRMQANKLPGWSPEWGLEGEEEEKPQEEVSTLPAPSRTTTTI